jgi:hypothetical protein
MPDFVLGVSSLSARVYGKVEVRIPPLVDCCSVPGSASPDRPIVFVWSSSLSKRLDHSNYGHKLHMPRR